MARHSAVGAVTLDLRPEDPRCATSARTFDEWVATIAPCLPFPDAASRRSFAVTVVAALEGAFVLARAAQSGEPFRHAGKSLAAMATAASGRRR